MGRNKNKNKKTNSIQNNIIPSDPEIPDLSNTNNVVNITIPMIYISNAHYTSINNDRTILRTENENLKKEFLVLENNLMEYCHNERLLKETIKIGEATIEELREENKKLKIEIEFLKTQIADQNDKIKILQKTNEMLNSRMDRIEANLEYDKCVIGIQDINDDERLETKLEPKIAQQLKEMREGRNIGCHYILKNDTEEIKNYKKYILYIKLSTMSNMVKNIFNRKNKNLIDNLLPHLKKKDFTPTCSDIIELCEQWFE